MEKSISNETLEKVKSLPRIDFLAFNELVIQKRVQRIIKFKTPKTIFFDESDGYFYYLNPYHKELHKCGFFTSDSDNSKNELS